MLSDICRTVKALLGTLVLKWLNETIGQVTSSSKASISKAVFFLSGIQLEVGEEERME